MSITKKSILKDVNTLSTGDDGSPDRSKMVLRSACLYGCNALELADRYNSSVNNSPNSHFRHHQNLHTHQHECTVVHQAVRHGVKSKEVSFATENTSFETSPSVNESIDIFETKKSTSLTKKLFVKLAKLQISQSYSDYSSGFDSDTEEKPKTDYTYARSRSYRGRVTPSKDSLNPNMSRTRLRGSGSMSEGSSDEEISYLLHGEKNSFSKIDEKYANKDPQAGTPFLLVNNNDYIAKSTITSQESSNRFTHLKEIVISNHSSQTIFQKTYTFLTTIILYNTFTFLSKLWLAFWHTVYSICYVSILDTWIISRCRKSWKKKLFLLLLLPLFVPLLFWLSGSSLSEHSSLEANSPNKISNTILSAFSKYSSDRNENWWHWLLFWERSVPIETVHVSVGDHDVSNLNIMSLEMKKLEEKFQEMYKVQSLTLAHQYLTVLNDKMAALNEEKQLLQKQVDAFSLQSIEYSEELNLLKEKMFAINIENERLNTLVNEEIEEKKEIKLNFQRSQGNWEYLHSQMLELRNCCHNQMSYNENEEKNFASFLIKLLNGTHKRGTPMAYSLDILQSRFVNPQDFSDLTLQLSKLAKIEGRAGASDLLREQEANSAKIKIDQQTAGSTISYSINNNHSATSSCPTEQDIRQIANNIVRNAIFIYDADKIGQFDYALESAGGSVISTRCAETYTTGTAQFSLFGMPIWYTSNSPRTVIQPEVLPGQCWAFKGTQGYLVIQLSTRVKPTAFTLEHIPKSLSPAGHIDSAPKEFSVMGLSSEKDLEGKFLGSYTYLDNTESLQYFHVQPQELELDYYPIIELRIHSNHGNMDYTCLYRFRVHGIPL